MAASPADLEAAKAQGAVIVDIRTAGEREEGYAAPGSIHRIWDGASLPTEGLPEDKSDPVIVY
jgi:rhodanese-related sulfurtransferase